MIKVAVISFPGNNCEVESMRALKESGMQPVYFRWNDDVTKLENIDGYFLPGGFSYEDRGRAGMVAGRDPIFDFLKQEALKGKVIIGNCNGAQVLVESGLIPNAQGLQMSLADNVVGEKKTGFISRWVFMKPACKKNRCATSNWEGVMHVPIAHGEGRFTTKDRTLWKKLIDNDQLAFTYCDHDGNDAPDASYNPNGSEMAAAGICNPQGNVIALMPHPERTPNGKPYFDSMRKRIEGKRIEDSGKRIELISAQLEIVSLSKRSTDLVEIFVDTIIVNNEERTVEQTAKRLVPSLTLKQLKYIAVEQGTEGSVLTDIIRFNPNKEVAYLRRGDSFTRWNADIKQEEPVDSLLEAGISILRTDDFSKHEGVCYVCSNVNESDLMKSNVLEVFSNPHATTLERL